jgi:hypothetical protein
MIGPEIAPELQPGMQAGKILLLIRAQTRV